MTRAAGGALDLHEGTKKPTGGRRLALRKIHGDPPGGGSRRNHPIADCVTTAAQFHPFQPTLPRMVAFSRRPPLSKPGRPLSLDPTVASRREWIGGGRGDALAEMPLDKPRAQLAFKDSMIRGILQFTLRIAFRCVLHRCKSQDIRC